MNEKKKLLIGIAGAILTAGILSALMSGNPFAKKEPKTFDFVNNLMREFQYDLNVSESKIAKEYEPLDWKRIEEKINGTGNIKKDSKIEEIKNNKGEIIGTKEYRKGGEIIITNLENGKIISTETIEKEKSKKYYGKATLVYSDGVKQNYTYKKGIKEGKAEILFTNGDREEYFYKKDVPEGEATYYFANGDKEIYNYKNGVIDGEAKYIYANGKEENYKYVNGERQ